jgi:hypothetical protein
MNRVDHPERAVAVAPRPLEGDAVTQAAHRDMGDAQAGAIDRYEPVDATLQAFVEEVFDAAQIAESFFADVADEGDGAGRLHVAGLEGAHHREHHGQATAVVADAGPANHRALLRGLDVGAFGKHGVEVGGEHEMRARCRARALPEHVANLVDADVLQAELAELARIELAASRFLERRRFHLADFDLLGQGAGFVGAGRGQGGLHGAVLHQLGTEVVGGLLSGGRGQRQKNQNGDYGDPHAAHSIAATTRR